MTRSGHWVLSSIFADNFVPGRFFTMPHGSLSTQPSRLLVRVGKTCLTPQNVVPRYTGEPSVLQGYEVVRLCLAWAHGVTITVEVCGKKIATNLPNFATGDPDSAV